MLTAIVLCALDGFLCGLETEEVLIRLLSAIGRGDENIHCTGGLLVAPVVVHGVTDDAVDGRVLSINGVDGRAGPSGVTLRFEEVRELHANAQTVGRVRRNRDPAVDCQSLDVRHVVGPGGTFDQPNDLGGRRRRQRFGQVLPKVRCARLSFEEGDPQRDIRQIVRGADAFGEGLDLRRKATPLGEREKSFAALSSAFGQRAFGVFIERGWIVALILADGAGFIGVEIGIAKLSPRKLDHPNGVGELEVVPKDSGGFEVTLGLARLDRGEFDPRRGGAVVALAVGFDLTDSRERFMITRAAFRQVLLDLDGLIASVQRPVQGSRAIADFAVRWETNGQLTERLGGGFVVGLPDFPFSEHTGGGGIRFRIGLQSAQPRQFGIEPPSAGEQFEETAPQVWGVIPILTEQLLIGDWARRASGRIGTQQVAHERQVMGKAFVGELVHLQIQLCADIPRAGGFLDVRFEVGAGEYLGDLAGQFRVVRLLASAQIPAGEPVAPLSVVGEALHGVLVDALDLRSHLVLV